jgi:hypothetical protein
MRTNASIAEVWERLGVDARGVLEALESEGGDPTPALAWLAVQRLALDADELSAARRRALLLLASGGDPRRELDPDSRAVGSLAADLDTPTRRAALRAALQDLRDRTDGLSSVAAALDALLTDPELAWRWAACGLLAEEFADAR